eukprot:GHRR01028845.1.p1 GENE.GHRR01028845.1~~GHRR01028845.1.p1  ORF type:complete len:101 (-),score=13.74 GHRR01028845.1:327-629(-)
MLQRYIAAAVWPGCELPFTHPDTCPHVKASCPQLLYHTSASVACAASHKHLQDDGQHALDNVARHMLCVATTQGVHDGQVILVKVALELAEVPIKGLTQN